MTPLLWEGAAPLGSNGRTEDRRPDSNTLPHYPPPPAAERPETSHAAADQIADSAPLHAGAGAGLHRRMRRDGLHRR